MEFSEFISRELNEQQKLAVTAGDGIFVIRAGAGSGKTRVITARITHLILINQQLPSSIVALTFTNKAAREMKERLLAYVPVGTPLPYVGTFHSYAVQLLKIYHRMHDLPDFTILDDDDQDALIGSIIQRFGAQKRVTVKAIKAVLSYEQQGAPLFDSDPLIGQIIAAYRADKERSHSYDFDDLLSKTLELFTQDPLFKRRFQERIKHVLVDEYQDTNIVQHRLLKAMAYTDTGKFILKSLCVVGDEDQSIYSWRGAQVTNMLEFARDFKGAVTTTIDQNYRSVQPILQVANGLIAHNLLRGEKKLWSARTARDRVRVVRFSSGYQEAELIAQLALVHRGLSLAGKHSSGTIAVLYRSHYQSRVIEEALIRHAIGYRMVGGIRFYQRQEIKDLLAYLRLVVNPHDRVAALRALNTPPRGIGAACIELIQTTWEREPLLDIFGLLKYLVQQSETTARWRTAFERFCAIFHMFDLRHDVYQAMVELIDRSGYMGYLEESSDREEFRTRSDNIKELLNSMRSRVLAHGGELPIEIFLEEVALMQEAVEEEQSDERVITLMTLHAAKGLEFDTVVVSGIEEGLLPSGRSVYDQRLIEEERRLLYVGITRARERLMLCYAQSRLVFGAVQDQRPSRFIAELPQQEYQFFDGTAVGSFALRQYVERWFM